MKFISKSEEDTKKIAKEICNFIFKNKKDGDKNVVICLIGEIGAGKTAFVKGIARYFNLPEENISSPSYTFINDYKKFYHLDLYKLYPVVDLDSIDFWNLLEENKPKVIEWANDILDELKLSNVDTYVVHIKRLDENSREIEVKKI